MFLVTFLKLSVKTFYSSSEQQQKYRKMIQPSCVNPGTLQYIVDQGLQFPPTTAKFVVRVVRVPITSQSVRGKNNTKIMHTHKRHTTISQFYLKK